MRPHNTLNNSKHRLTDADRDACLKLLQSGLSCLEISQILPVSRSSVDYVRRAHSACLSQDWDSLRTVAGYCRSTAEWALKVTKSSCCLDMVTTPKTSNEVSSSVPVGAEEVKEMLTDIRNLLTEIRDILK